MMKRGIPSAGTVVKDLIGEDWKWYTLNFYQLGGNRNTPTLRCGVAHVIMVRTVIGLRYADTS